MITSQQIKTLCDVGKLDTHEYENIIIGVYCEKDQLIQLPYDTFMQKMNLPDMRLTWLLGKRNFLAGGSVLNWIWQEEKNQDIDFFFYDLSANNDFELFVKNYFTLTRESCCAKTYVNKDNNLIVQLVGTERAPSHFFGSPAEILERFDLSICKFAVDADYFYTTSFAIRDFISMSVINTKKKEKDINYLGPSAKGRLFKYSRKGFYADYKCFR